MTYSSFSSAFLVAAYQEAQDRSHDLLVGDILDHYNLKGRSGWASTAMDEFARKGFVERDDVLGDERQLTVMLLGPGLREAERMIASGLRVTRLPASMIAVVQATDAAADFSVADADVDPDPQTSNFVQSSKWTGLPTAFVLSEQKRAALVSALDILESNLTLASASQEDRAQARAYVIAMRSLAEAPDPPSDLIWEILQRANALAGVASLFVSLLGLFIK